MEQKKTFNQASDYCVPIKYPILSILKKSFARLGAKIQNPSA